MISKQELKTIAKLLQKKYRDSEKKFIAEGKRLIAEGLQSNYKCEYVFVTELFKANYPDFLKKLKADNIKTVTLAKTDFNKLASTKNSQGIVAVFNIPEKNFSNKDSNIIIGLENISDPGNLGTILRSCDWFGIKTILLSEGCTDLYNPKVVRASMGAIFNLSIIENTNFNKVLTELKNKNYKIFFADMQGEDYRKINYNNPTVVIFCNEAFGPTNELKQVCDTAITIPRKGRIDSLNVAAAAAVILSQASNN